MTKARDLASGGFGLVLVKPSSVVGGTDNGKGTVSFSAASTVSLNDVFSSTYTNYRIFISATSSQGETDGRLRFRVGGADETGVQYIYSVQSLGANGTSYNSLSTGTTFIMSGRIGGNGLGQIVIDIANPFATARTTTTSNVTADGTTTLFKENGAGLIVLTTSYTGFTIFPTGGTITGTVSVYGYNK